MGPDRAGQQVDASVIADHGLVGIPSQAMKKMSSFFVSHTPPSIRRRNVPVDEPANRARQPSERSNCSILLKNAHSLAFVTDDTGGETHVIPA